MTDQGETNADRVVAQIERAFADVVYPGDDHLVYDASGYHLEAAEIATAFRGRHWRDVPLATLKRESSGLFFMTPAAYRFYLPAYLIAAIRAYDETDTLPGSVVFSLTAAPAEDPGRAESFRARVADLTPSQRDAIRSFLEFLAAEHGRDFPLGDIERALDSSWRS
jgi:hypothetical protein